MFEVDFIQNCVPSTTFPGPKLAFDFGEFPFKKEPSLAVQSAIFGSLSFFGLWWSKDPTLGIRKSETNKYIGREEKKISRSPQCHTQTITHFIVGFREKKHPSHPSQPPRGRFSYTPSAMSTKSPVASWISRESRLVTYGGGTSFEVISGRLTTQKLRHTHDMSGKLPSIL